MITFDSIFIYSIKTKQTSQIIKILQTKPLTFENKTLKTNKHITLSSLSKLLIIIDATDVVLKTDNNNLR